ncbi:hypothetical protein C1645_813145 [Glomus cerebriforme]|uniref:Uncharacterized protein n=1 Tax=Glomus cerebriforme TaxID=658196 RepID=A0A397TIN7_9GLOM|nr:hypothetical protein C1645_813145 [Glomus cerebriforme]
MDDSTNINNTSISNIKYGSKHSDVPSHLGIITKTGKDPPPQTSHHVDNIFIDTFPNKPVPSINNNIDNTATRLSCPHDLSREQNILLPPKDHVPIATPMQDITLLAPINIITNNHKSIEDRDLPSLTNSPHASSSIILMDTSSSNDTLIKKANKKNKKKLIQDIVTTETPDIGPLHVPTDMLIDITECNPAQTDSTSYNETPQAIPSVISQEILDITFNEIVNESIDMLVDYLDSTHLSESCPTLTKNQLFT